MLLNFPGKRWQEQRLVRRRKVLRAINWLRDRFGRSPLELDITRPTPMPSPRTSGQPYCALAAPLGRIDSRFEEGLP
jgi:hypothetical protein